MNISTGFSEPTGLWKALSQEEECTVTDDRIKTHIQRALHPQRPIALLTPEEEAEQERDLVPIEQWGPVTILPRHRRGDVGDKDR